MNQWMISVDKQKLLNKMMESRKLENTMFEMNNSLGEFFSILVTIEEKVNELKDAATEATIRSTEKKKA